jgi:hypothetical protein
MERPNETTRKTTEKDRVHLWLILGKETEKVAKDRRYWR